MKKIILILFLVIFPILLIATSGNACGVNQILINMWNSREDLQEQFPGDPECNPNLEQWAKDTGWLKHKELIDYSPLKEEFHGLSQRIIQLENRIKELEQNSTGSQNIILLENRIKGLEQNSAGSQTTTIVTNETEGEWRKCIAYTSGSIRCDDYVQDKEYNGWNYEFYVNAKNYNPISGNLK
jgi:hypothetical protein